MARPSTRKISHGLDQDYGHIGRTKGADGRESGAKDQEQGETNDEMDLRQANRECGSTSKKMKTPTVAGAADDTGPRLG